MFEGFLIVSLSKQVICFINILNNSCDTKCLLKSKLLEVMTFWFTRTWIIWSSMSEMCARLRWSCGAAVNFLTDYKHQRQTNWPRSRDLTNKQSRCTDYSFMFHLFYFFFVLDFFSYIPLFLKVSKARQIFLFIYYKRVSFYNVVYK